MYFKKQKKKSTLRQRFLVVEHSKLRGELKKDIFLKVNLRTFTKMKIQVMFIPVPETVLIFR